MERNIYYFKYNTIKPTKLSNNNISITTLEQNIFNFLLENNPFKSTFRIVGGWVRDKLLNKESNDIDITIDNISGKEYVNAIKNKGIKIIHNSNTKSQHLLTATFILYNTTIDIVNLRKEVYSSNSRVPNVTQGTPIDDALRRDITINSLFYNINKNIIEDYTNQGIPDLSNGIIRTVKKAYDSFIEDPLRILRVIRFAYRLSFSIDIDIENTIKDIKVLEHFTNILTYSRMYKELEGMIKCNNIHWCILILYNNNYLNKIINLGKDIDINNDLLKSVNYLFTKYYILEQIKYIKVEEQDNIILNYVLLLCSIRNKEIYINKKTKYNGSKYVIIKLFNMANNIISDIMNIIDNINVLKEIINKKEYNIVDIGILMRSIKKKAFESCLIVCICEEYIEAVDIKEPIKSIDIDILKGILEKYNKFREYIKLENLNRVYDMKLIMDGKELKEVLNIKEGKKIGKYLNILTQEQIKNKDITKEEAINILKNNII